MKRCPGHHILLILTLQLTSNLCRDCLKRKPNIIFLVAHDIKSNFADAQPTSYNQLFWSFDVSDDDGRGGWA
jgi:hypothetical protein